MKQYALSLLWLSSQQLTVVSLAITQGDPVKALYYREQALVRRQETDVGDEEFGDFCYVLAVQYNSVAMASLREGTGRGFGLMG